MLFSYIAVAIGIIGVILFLIGGIRLARDLSRKKNPPNPGNYVLTYIGIGLAFFATFSLDINLARAQGRLVDQMSRMIEIQDRIIETQDRIIENQDRIIENQIKMLENQEKMITLLEKIAEK